MSDKTERLKLETPVSGSFGWHVEWGNNMEALDKHPGILPCTSTTRPESPWHGQAIFETDTENMFVFDGASWRQVRLIKDHGFTPPGGFEPMARISGHYYGPHGLFGSSGTITLIVDRLHFVPFVVTQHEQFDRIAAAIITADPGYWRLAFFDSGPDLLPLNRLILTGKTHCDTPRNVYFNVSLDLSPGIYWPAIISDSAPAVRTFFNAYSFRFFGSASIDGSNTNRVHIDCGIDNVPETITPGSLSYGWGFPEIRLRKS